MKKPFMLISNPSMANSTSRPRGFNLCSTATQTPIGRNPTRSSFPSILFRLLQSLKANLRIAFSLGGKRHKSIESFYLSSSPRSESPSAKSSNFTIEDCLTRHQFASCQILDCLAEQNNSESQSGSQRSKMKDETFLDLMKGCPNMPKTATEIRNKYVK
jgi:hypothetical protein